MEGRVTGGQGGGGFLAWDKPGGRLQLCQATLWYPGISQDIPGYAGPGICAPGEAC